jgi:DMSO/TMAO reductase YedYZ molybdopterin-dependent catalytic subunit
MMTTRRRVLQTALGGLALAGGGLGSRLASAALPQGALDSAVMERLPGKQPLIKRSYRPPNFESPLSYFEDAITPNDRFFVRWHLMGIAEVDAREWRLSIGGDAASKPFELTLEQLKHDFEPVEVVAVCQCSGNRRGLSDPHVPGVEWGYGAMGNARWKGARLKDILARAGLSQDTVEVAFDGADRPALDVTPDFIKSLPVWKALDENTIVAYEMNGEPLPHHNGYPARLVVPGWTATYWMKQVVSIQALSKPLSNFWMASAYRIPKGKFAIADRFVTQENETTTPITEIVVNSVITSHTDGARVTRGQPLTLKGVAWDSGAGIRRVEVSRDGGRVWEAADLGADLGRFSFRPWQLTLTPTEIGPLVLMARATNRQGSTQVSELIFNNPGYHNNVIQAVALTVV